jgi:hypothetical protein
MRRDRASGAIGGAWGCGLLLCASLLGCGPGEAKAPNQLRPIDERRAIEIIRRAISQEGERPALGRDVKVPSNASTLHIDVGIEGHSYGIAYVSPDEMKGLPDRYQLPNKKDEMLRILPTEDGETKVVILYQQNYRYDDLVGETHEQTVITAESELARDVRDFVTHAKSKKFK